MTENKITDFARQAQEELELMAAGSMGFPTVVNFILSLILVIFGFSTVDLVLLLSWLLFMFVVMGLRLLSQKLLRQPKLFGRLRERYFAFFQIANLLNGAGWGVTVIFLFPVSDPLQQMVLICLILGIAAG
ncbi:MAG: hypothetical protein U9Q58_08420, partial [Pseudomonadota bacterium]|nr:hypothetical protein [Pseudomonadota bacterium]